MQKHENHTFNTVRREDSRLGYEAALGLAIYDGQLSWQIAGTYVQIAILIIAGAFSPLFIGSCNKGPYIAGLLASIAGLLLTAMYRSTIARVRSYEEYWFLSAKKLESHLDNRVNTVKGSFHLAMPWFASVKSKVMLNTLFGAFFMAFLAASGTNLLYLGVWVPSNCHSSVSSLTAPHTVPPKPPPTASPSAQTILIKVANIGPFPTGKHQLDGNSVAACMQRALKPFANSPPNGWQVIGRVDKRELLAESATIYGSNQGLAMARAVWVRDIVLSRFDIFQPDRAVLAVGGPESVGSEIGETKLKLDREVEIYLFVDHATPTKPGERIQTTLPPVVCS